MIKAIYHIIYKPKAYILLNLTLFIHVIIMILHLEKKCSYISYNDLDCYMRKGDIYHITFYRLFNTVGRTRFMV